MATLVLAGLLVALIAYLGFETTVHAKRQRAIPIRIHVNGTRGKSSTVRLIAAGLRSTGKVVCAKTTGTNARMILPNARELPLFRPLGANIREQLRVVRLAASLRADILVIECMALQPELQWLSERWFVNATHGVITNCRPDHLDVMGPDAGDVALALCGMVPRKGALFTGEERFLPTIAEACTDRSTKLHAITPDDVAQITTADMAGFRHREHPQNVATALAICTSLGAERQGALEEMWRAPPDAGAQIVVRVDFFGRELLFVNGFAANDPESSAEIWSQSVAEHGAGHSRIALINCRADRPDRSRQHGEAVATWEGIDQVIAMGTGTPIFSRAAMRAGLDATKLRVLEDRNARELFETLVGLADGGALVVGLCNIGGEGLDLVQLIRNRGHLVQVT